MASESVYHKTHRRINELRDLDLAYGEGSTDAKIGEMVRNAQFAAKWTLPVDYVPSENNSASEDELDYTLNITADRLILLGPNRKVPAAFLPSYISYLNAVVTGTLVSETEFDVHGEPVTPSMDNVYYDTLSHEYYRWVPQPTDPDDEDTGKYCPIANGLQMVDGEGTVVNDSGTDYQRSIDLNLGTPADPYDASVTDEPLSIYNGQLVHRTLSNTMPANYMTRSGPGDNQTPGFGDEFIIPHFSVTGTGHVYDNLTGTALVRMPSTPATDTVPGLVKIGTTVTQVANASSAGTIPSSGYALVSAADHCHSADPITFTFGRQGDDVVYRMSEEKTVDFNKILLAKLPANDPAQLSGDPVVLGLNSVGTGNSSPSAWKTAMAAMPPEEVTIPEVSSYDMSGAAQAPSQISTVLSGMKPDAVYQISARISVEYTSADGEIRNFSIIAKSNNAEVCRRSFTVEGQRSAGQGKYVLDMIGVTGGSDLSLWLSVDSGEFPASANYKLSVSGGRVTRLR